MSGRDQLVQDLEFVFARFPLTALLHLRANRHRLVRSAYMMPDGRGCIFFLLSELLPPEQRISSASELTRYFGGDPAAPQYQPGRWLVRLWDRHICDGVRTRYGDNPELTEELLTSVLDDVITQRQLEQDENVTIVYRIPVGPRRPRRTTAFSRSAPAPAETDQSGLAGTFLQRPRFAGA